MRIAIYARLDPTAGPGSDHRPADRQAEVEKAAGLIGRPGLGAELPSVRPRPRAGLHPESVARPIRVVIEAPGRIVAAFRGGSVVTRS
jgi:hypothetical protein